MSELKDVTIEELIKHYQQGKLKNEAHCYNIKTMKKIIEQI